MIQLETREGIQSQFRFQAICLEIFGHLGGGITFPKLLKEFNI